MWTWRRRVIRRSRTTGAPDVARYRLACRTYAGLTDLTDVGPTPSPCPAHSSPATAAQSESAAPSPTATSRPCSRRPALDAREDGAARSASALIASGHADVATVEQFARLAQHLLADGSEVEARIRLIIVA